jgi:hypothetical protein
MADSFLTNSALVLQFFVCFYNGGWPRCFSECNISIKDGRFHRYLPVKRKLKIPVTLSVINMQQCVVYFSISTVLLWNRTKSQ